MIIEEIELPINESMENHATLKERCKRLRYVETMTRFKNEWQDYEQWKKSIVFKNVKKKKMKF